MHGMSAAVNKRYALIYCFIENHAPTKGSVLRRIKLMQHEALSPNQIFRIGRKSESQTFYHEYRDNRFVQLIKCGASPHALFGIGPRTTMPRCFLHAYRYWVHSTSIISTASTQMGHNRQQN